MRWAEVGCTCTLGVRLPSPAVRATLQGTGTQLRDAQAKNEQLVARVQEVQAMLAMDTGRLLLAPALALCLSQGGQPPPRAGCQPGLPSGHLGGGCVYTHGVQSAG